MKLLVFLLTASALAVDISGPWQTTKTLSAGEVIDISVHLPAPTDLPLNGRLRVQLPAAGLDKILHALDPSVFIRFRAPANGDYRLSIAPLEQQTAPNRQAATGAYLLRDRFAANDATPLPEHTPWPPGHSVPVTCSITGVAHSAHPGLVIETEPNNSPGEAIPITFSAGRAVIIGGADDLEYHNNLEIGSGRGDDWYRFTWDGPEKQLMANLQVIEPIVPPRLRWYSKTGSVAVGDSRSPVKREEVIGILPKQPSPKDAALRDELARHALGHGTPEGLTLNRDGRDVNERRHQQQDIYRKLITRTLKPGGSYYLRVEANHPAYEIELRLFDPAPYTDPERAIEHGQYYHMAEVHAWMSHRPRNVVTYQRARVSPQMAGEMCMSCHAQAGVWSSSEALTRGYPVPIGNALNWRQLRNWMYESLRPTNKDPNLRGAVVMSSANPDTSDGIAGTRVAGQNVTLSERYTPAPALHDQQILRTADFLCNTQEPKGINAAGRGANFGPNVVYKFAGITLAEAWRRTQDERYRKQLVAMAEAILDPANEKKNNAVIDDLGHRLEFVHDIWPEAADSACTTRLRKQAAKDLERALALQREDGGWTFPFKNNENSHPAPTAVVLVGLKSAGLSRDHPAVRRGIDYLLSTQKPYGLWLGGETGFVTGAYVLRALTWWHQRATPPRPAIPDNALLAARWRAAYAEPANFANTPFSRYYQLIALGAAKQGLSDILAALDAPIRMHREAAFWALRQHLLDDRAWPETRAAFAAGSDLARETILHALRVRVSPYIDRQSYSPEQLLAILSPAFADSAPAVRAAAYRASHHWYGYNDGLREPIAALWQDALSRPEADARAAISLRYTGAAYIQHPYHHQLPALLAQLDRPATAHHLLAMTATYFRDESGQGPRQQRWSQTEQIGAAARSLIEGDDPRWARIALDAAGGIRDIAMQRSIFKQLRANKIAALPAISALATPRFKLPAEAEHIRWCIDYFARLRADGHNQAAETFKTFLSRLEWQDAAAPFYQALAGAIATRPELAFPIGETLKINGHLRRAEAFALIPKLPEQLTDWQCDLLLPNTEWMLKFQGDDALRSTTEAPKGALEADTLPFELTGGRIDPADPQTAIGLATGNAHIWWREGKPGAELSFTVAAEAGPHLIDVQFIHSNDGAILQPLVNGQPLGPEIGLYKSFMAASGPISLGACELRKGDNQIAFRITGAVAESATLAMFAAGIDYLHVRPHKIEGLEASRATSGKKKLDPLARQRVTLAAAFARSLTGPHREAAIKLANNPTIRANPDIRAALRALADSATDNGLKDQVARVLDNENKAFRSELEKHKARSLPDAEFATLVHFRDVIWQELNRLHPDDGKSCLSCHGIKGKVPPFYLYPPDATGALSAPDLLANFAAMRNKVDQGKPESSPLLLKPLDVVIGDGDGHQGGKRYERDSPGFQVLRDWVMGRD